MNDMSQVIVPKSDQINADDLISGPMNITIREVRIKRGDEQPVDIYFDGSDKAYRPCKSMSRVLVHIWGPDAGKYNGRSLTLYRDPKVRFGKDAVGGIRISHMTDIPADKLDNGRVIMSLTATRAQRKPHVVMPLVFEQPTDKAADGARALLQRIKNCDPADIGSITGDATVTKQRAWLAKNRPELAAEIDQAIAEIEDDPFTNPNETHGERFTDDADPAVWQSTADEIERLLSTDRDAAEALYRQHMMALPKEVCDRIEAGLGGGK